MVPPKSKQEYDEYQSHTKEEPEYSTMGRQNGYPEQYPVYDYNKSPHEVEYKSENDPEIDADIGNVEDIQKELYQMDMNHK